MNTTYTKTWTITLQRSDIYFDLEQLSLDLAEVSSGDNLRRHDRIAVDMKNDNDERVVRRLCEHRLSRIRQQLSRFIAPATGSNTTTGSDILSTGSFVITLAMPTEAEENTIPSLTSQMHQYIVSGALADYYEQLGYSANRESLNNTADAAMAAIRELIYYRPMP